MTPKLVDLFAFLSVILRAGTLIFQSLLLGGVLFVLCVAQVSLESTQGGLDRIHSSCCRLLRASAIGLAVVELLYLYVNSTVLMETADIGIASVVGANFFIAGCLVIMAALLMAFCANVRRNIATWALPGLAVVTIFASVTTSHAASRIEGRALLITLSCIHLVSTGFWIGGLPFLMLALLRARDSGTRWSITKRFSRIAVVSVGMLVGSGALMSLLYIGSWKALLANAYGVMVGAKAIMLAALLVLGGMNNLLLRTSTPKDDGIHRLRRLIEAEVGIGITVILTAASLTSQPPPVDQRNQSVTLQQIYQRFRPVMPRLTYEYVAEPGSLTRHATAGVVVLGSRAEARNIDGVPLTGKMINDAIESESNHHWMGLIVLAMGLLVVLSRTGGMAWAAYWPLLLVGVAIFISVQADTECWPVGPKSFWKCWADPEVFQHRLAGLVCLGFAISEQRVRRQKPGSKSLALVFPLMCAAGGTALLTHSHAIPNVKENLLVELSHVPMGVLAVFAGWSRWLELRLHQKDRGIPSWIWPACFILIGLGLLNYREM